MTTSSCRSRPEWPAAHSMDTTWFAVDADGCVGVFDTGEDGALPAEAGNGGGAGEPSFDTFFLDAALLAAASTTDPDVVPPPPNLDQLDPKQAHRVVVFLVDPRLVEGAASHRSSPNELRTIEDELPHADWRVIRAADPRVLASGASLAVEDIRRIAKRRDVQTVTLRSGLGWFDEGGGGAFHYHHDWKDDAYEPGRYARTGEAPENALKLSELQPEAAEHVGLMKLPFRFADTAHFQLADFVRDEDCHIWAENTSLRGDPLVRENEKKAPAGAGASALDKRVALVRLAVVLALVVAAIVHFLLRKPR